MSKPYSYRYASDIRAALEPWRQEFSDIHGTNVFDQVVSALSDRDRAIEDYLSLGVAQGYLGIGFVPNGGQGLTASYADITDATVTFSVPAGRRIRLHVYCDIINLDASTRSSFIRVLDQNSTVIVGTSRDNAASGTREAAQQFRETVFTTPAAGTHTYKLQALINGGSGTLTSNVPADNGGGSSFISVEDAGPATR